VLEYLADETEVGLRHFQFGSVREQEVDRISSKRDAVVRDQLGNDIDSGIALTVLRIKGRDCEIAAADLQDRFNAAFRDDPSDEPGIIGNARIVGTIARIVLLGNQRITPQRLAVNSSKHSLI